MSIEIRFRCPVDSLFALIDNRAVVLTLFSAFAVYCMVKIDIKFYLGEICIL